MTASRNYRRRCRLLTPPMPQRLRSQTTGQLAQPDPTTISASRAWADSWPGEMTAITSAGGILSWKLKRLGHPAPLDCTTASASHAKVDSRIGVGTAKTSVRSPISQTARHGQLVQQARATA